MVVGIILVWMVMLHSLMPYLRGARIVYGVSVAVCASIMAAARRIVLLLPFIPGTIGRITRSIGRRLLPLALAVDGVHLSQRLQRVTGRRRAVTAIVPRRCSRVWRAPHQNRLTWRFTAVNLRLYVLQFRR